MINGAGALTGCPPEQEPIVGLGIFIGIIALYYGVKWLLTKYKNKKHD